MQIQRVFKILASAAVLIGLSACTATPPLAPRAVYTPIENQCAEFLTELDRTITRAGVRDAQAARVPGFVYLRVNRFLASFADEPLSGAAFNAWVDRMQGLAEQGWETEWRNLPKTEQQRLYRATIEQGKLHDSDDALSAVKMCGVLLRYAELQQAEARERLRAQAHVPDEYRSWQRVAGLYPLTALAFAAGIHRWQAETRRVFAHDLGELPVHGQLTYFAPPADLPPLTFAESATAPSLARGPRLDPIADVSAILARSARNPLRIPEPDANDRARLFAAFAPRFEIDVVSAADRIGTPAWGAAPYPLINTARPVVYTYLSHTRYRDAILVQLNYVVWFPARPRSGPLDLLGGPVDGLTWRVTLTPDGQPWLYDVMHNCGCYHLFFTTPRAQARAPLATLDEQAFIPQSAPALTIPNGLTLRIAHSTHYVQRLLDRRGPTTITYQWADYNDLRALPAAHGTRSMFGPDGIVPGTDRLERYLFWPMGVPHPGAMRQAGHHATAFVGRRHFDDPDLLEKNFELIP